MLDFNFYNYIRIVRIASCLAIAVPCFSRDIPIRLADYHPIDVIDLQKQMEKIKNIENPEEIIDFIYQIREYAIAQGFQFPPLTDIATYLRNILRSQQGIEIDDEVFQDICDELEKIESDKEEVVITTRHHNKDKKKKKNKELKINSKTATGFLKFVGGSLLALIPIPLVQTAGVTLAIIGVNDMVDGAREQSDQKDVEDRLEENRRIERNLNQPL